MKREGLDVDVDDGVEEGVKGRGVELVMTPLVVLVTPVPNESWAVSGVKSILPLTDRQYWNRTLSSTDDTVRFRLNNNTREVKVQ